MRPSEVFKHSLAEITEVYYVSCRMLITGEIRFDASNTTVLYLIRGRCGPKSGIAISMSSVLGPRALTHIFTATVYRQADRELNYG